MNSTDSARCAEMQELLAERASGPLERQQEEGLDAHLSSCPSCRADAAQWQSLFAAVALPAPSLREEAALRGLPDRALLGWRRQERHTHRLRMVSAAAAMLIAASVPLVLWTAHTRPTDAAPHLAAGALSTVQVDWTDGPTWDTDEQEAPEASAEDATLLDGLAFEGDGAFAPGDSG